MLLDGALAVFVLHEVDFDDVALAALLFFDNILDFFGAEEVVSALQQRTGVRESTFLLYAHTPSRIQRYSLFLLLLQVRDRHRRSLSNKRESNRSPDS